jgi:hypothetical protein
MIINRFIIIGFFMVLAGAVLPFLIVMDILPSTFWLNIVAYLVSVCGLFLGIIGIATYVGEKRKQDEWSNY